MSQFDAAFTARSATASCLPDGTLGVYVQREDERMVVTRLFGEVTRVHAPP